MRTPAGHKLCSCPSELLYQRKRGSGLLAAALICVSLASQELPDCLNQAKLTVQITTVACWDEVLSDMPSAIALYSDVFDH